MYVTDQMQRRIRLPHWPPCRIVSLVPSQTELLADLGLAAQVVGITKFCLHPAEWFESKPRVGGTKTLNFEKIAALQPDLILGNKEENEREQIEVLEEKFPVWMSDIGGLTEALDMIRLVGRLTDRADKADVLASGIEAAFAQISFLREEPPMTAAYLIWRKPYMAAGAGTFIQDMLQHAGFYNVFGDKPRYPELSLPMLADARPEVVLLSSEPYPFAEKHLAELQSACPDARIMLVDGEMFSWYGSRLKYAPGYFRELREKLKHPFCPPFN